MLAIKILRNEPERVQALRDISDYMRNCLKEKGIKIIESSTPIIPIYTYEDRRTFLACKMLLEEGVYVNPVVSPATPVGQSLIRTSYTATHTKGQMNRAVEKIAKVLSSVEEVEKNLFGE